MISTKETKVMSPCSEGAFENSPAFQRRVGFVTAQVPKGRLTSTHSSAVPSGLGSVCAVVPALKRRAIFERPYGTKVGVNLAVFRSGMRNRTPRFEQSFEVGLGSLLKIENGFASVASVSMTAGQQMGFGNPQAVFVAPRLDFRNGNYHVAKTITVLSEAVNALEIFSN